MMAELLRAGKAGSPPGMSIEVTTAFSAQVRQKTMGKQKARFEGDLRYENDTQLGKGE